MKRELSRAQEKRLLSKHITGDVGAGKWPTLEVLLNKGYLEVQRLEFDRIIITKKGIDYCNTYHQSM